MSQVKIFQQEAEHLYNRLKSRKPFAFSKFADGEWAIITNAAVDNGEFAFDPKHHKEDRQRLINAYQFVDDGYYVGISCPCCQGRIHYDMRQYCPSDDEHITFANIFVNSNYTYYQENFIPEYDNWDVHLVCSRESFVYDLPFDVETYYPVDNSALRENYKLIEYIKKENLKNKLFLFACGPFGNVLAHQLWEDNKENTYLDIGSTLNPWLQSEGFKRHYYEGKNAYSARSCVWGQYGV